MPPSVDVQTTTNQYLCPEWVDQVLRDNLFFGKVLARTKKWNGSQMLFPKLIVSPYFEKIEFGVLMGK